MSDLHPEAPTGSPPATGYGLAAELTPPQALAARMDGDAAERAEVDADDTDKPTPDDAARLRRSLDTVSTDWERQRDQIAALVLERDELQALIDAGQPTLASELLAARAAIASQDTEIIRLHDVIAIAHRERDEAREQLAEATPGEADFARLAADLDYARRGALAAIEKRDEARGERSTAREERRNAEDERDRLRARLTGISVIFRGAVLTDELERAPGDATTEELRAVAAILWGTGAEAADG